jgi:sugar lactone lactonase YvrE
MAVFDQTLIAPTADELVKALARAQKTANSGLPDRHLEKADEEWEKAARKVGGRRAEGRLHWNAARGRTPFAHVMLAWWTDRLGRRHVRVLGCPHPAQGPLCQLDHPEKAPIWAIYPTRLIERRRDGRADLLAVCSCGVCGSLPGLAWMGDRCGPCHDRREESESVPLCPLQVQVDSTHWGDLDDLLFLDNGKRLAFRLHGRLAVWDLETGELSSASASDGLKVFSLTADPDGHHLLIGTKDGIYRVEPPAGKAERIIKTRDAVFHLAVAPDGRRAYFHIMHEACFGDLTAGTCEPAPWMPAHEEDIQFSPDGRALFATTINGRIVRVDVDSQTSTVLHDENARPNRSQREPQLALSLDGRWLVTSCNRDDTALVIVDARTGKTAIVPLPDGEEIKSPAFAPDSRTVAVSARFATLFYDVVAEKALGALAGVGGWVKGLAFSPNGQTLAVSSHDGEVRLLPWQQLLAASAG